MTLIHELADIALATAKAPDEEALQARLLWNIAASHGEHDEGARFSSAGQSLHSGGNPGSIAFRIAVAMHARTQDDFYPDGRVHVGATVIPAVLAVGTDRVIPTIAAGYEVMGLISRTYSAVAQERGFRPTGMFAPMGAAAAAGVALGLDRDELASCLSIASVASAGTNQSWMAGSDEWLLEVGAAARAGAEAAFFAQGGLRGAPDGLEGPAGWARAYFNDVGAARLAAAIEAYEGQIAPRVALKPHPVSGIAQVPVAAALKVRAALQGEPSAVRVMMSPAECRYPGTANRGPFSSRSDALMSVPRCVALALHNGAVSYRDLVRPLTGREQLLLDKIELVPTPSLGETAVTVSVEDQSQTLQATVIGDDVLYPTWESLRGDPHAVAMVCEASADLVDRTLALIESGAPSAAFLPLWDNAT